LAGLGDRQVGRFLQRGAGIGALHQVGFGLACDVFFNPCRDAVAARCRNRLGEDAAVLVQNGIGGFGGRFGEEAGEERHGEALAGQRWVGWVKPTKHTVGFTHPTVV
jgi:hypothetical protein